MSFMGGYKYILSQAFQSNVNALNENACSSLTGDPKDSSLEFSFVANISICGIPNLWQMLLKEL